MNAVIIINVAQFPARQLSFRRAHRSEMYSRVSTTFRTRVLAQRDSERTLQPAGRHHLWGSVPLRSLQVGQCNAEVSTRPTRIPIRNRNPDTAMDAVKITITSTPVQTP